MVITNFNNTDANKYQSLENDHNEQRINFDGRKSGGDGKTFNYSVLSRSKSGDNKHHSSSKHDKESINTGAENLYYGKTKENNGSKQVLIEEIEIPLDEQHNEDKANENKKTEKNIHSVSKTKVIDPKKSTDSYKQKVNDEKIYQRNNSIEKGSKIKSERKTYDSHPTEDQIDKKRKQSDLIIKKSKFNLNSGSQSKSTSPVKHANHSSEDPQSS